MDRQVSPPRGLTVSRVALALMTVGFVGLVDLSSPRADQNDPDLPRLPTAIAEFRRQLWSKKPAGQKFDLIVTDAVVTETLKWALAENPDVPFRRPEIRFHPGGLAASAWAHVLGQQFQVSGRAAISFDSGSLEFAIESLEVAGVEAPDVVREAVLGALHLARDSYFDVTRLPLDLTDVGIEQGAARVAGTFRRLKKSHLSAD